MKTNTSLSRAIVFVNGVVDDYQSLETFIKPSDKIICADGGLGHAVKLSLPVTALLGDMDSLEVEHLNHLDGNTQVYKVPVEKDQTDMELALRWVLDAGFAEVVIVGIDGGRLDHTLANIHLLSQRYWSFQSCFWKSDQYTWLLKDNQTLNLDGYLGKTISIIPMSESVDGVTVKGMKYKLCDDSLKFGSTRGISNEIVCESARIKLRKGVLAAILTKI